MTWYPIAFLPPQIENSSGDPYSGAVLKAYQPATNTNIPFATDYTGVTTMSSVALNASGHPTQGGSVVIPHVSQNYKLALYPNQAAADLDSGAIWTVDNIQIAASTNSSFVQYFDGTGAQTVFTLSQNFGTDENILMVFADRTAGSTKREIRRPDEYTLVGNQLTLSDAPPSGTKNIIVFAPSLLLGAANNAAAAAATSEANALAYKNAALASQNAAAVSEANAAASYDSFDDRYLGSKAANPTLDNDGNALLDGALYWNNVTKQWRIYDLGTTSWVAAVVNPSGGPFLPVSGGTITGALTVNGAFTAPSLNGGAFAGNRNAVMNGDFSVWQRGTSFASAASGIYAPDRWGYTKIGAMVHDIIQSTDVPTVAQAGRLFTSSLHLDCTTVDSSIAAGDIAAMFHRVEGFMWAPFAQRNLVLSFWVKATKTGIYCVGLVNGAGDRSYVGEYTVNATNTWEYKTLVVPPSPSAGTWNYTSGSGLQILFVLAAGTTFQQAAGSWNAVNCVASANQVNACDNTANDFKLTGVQLEPGLIATPFETIPLPTLFAQCQRYFQLCGWGAVGHAYATTAASFRQTFPVIMRAAPTLSFFTTSVTYEMPAVATPTSAASTFASSDSAPQGYAVQVTGYTGMTIGQTGTCKTNFLNCLAEI